MATGTVRVRLDANTIENIKLFQEKTKERIDAVTVPRAAQRQYDGHKGSQRAGAIDNGGLSQLPRDALKKRYHDPYNKR